MQSAARVELRQGAYFGWRVVAAMFLIAFALMGVAIYAFIIFAKPIADQFGWSPAQTGGLVSAMWTAAPLALFCAPIIRRIGAWRLIIFGMCIQAVALVSLQLIGAFWQLYLLRMAMGVGKILVMTSLPVIVARWFDRRFAFAMAIAWTGGSAGGLVVAPLAEILSHALGWKVAAMVLAAGVLTVVAIAALLARGAKAPADLGLPLDGLLDAHREPRPPGDQTKVAQPTDGGEPADLRAVARSINWVTALVMFISIVGAGMAAIAIQSQEPALFEAAGLSPAVSAGLLGLTAGACVLGGLVIGWMLDRLHVLWSSLTVAGAMFGGLYAFSALTHVPNLPLAVIAAVGVGYTFGGGEVLWIALVKRQFGDAAFATTYGGFYFAIQLGYASGGYVGGWSLQNYMLSGFLVSAALMYLAPAVFSIWRPGGAKLISPPELAQRPG